MSEVKVHLSPALDLLSRSLQNERRVASLIEASLRAAGGPWEATLTPSAALDHFWVVRIARGGNGRAERSVIFDERAPEPDAQLLRAIAELAATSAAPGPGNAPPPGELRADGILDVEGENG